MRVPLWRRDGPYFSEDRQMVPGLTGPVGQVSQAPAILVQRELQNLADGPYPLDYPLAERLAWLRVGAVAFAGELDGESLAAYQTRVVLATGLPLHWVEQSMLELTGGLRAAETALQRMLPGGDLALLEEPFERLPGGGWRAWVPKGRSLAFIAPSNHPAVHLTWALALALGYQVVLRPGREDPFTPYRLVQALRQAGMPSGLVRSLPCGHEEVERLLDGTDRAILYGGDALARRFGQRQGVLFNGPGRVAAYVDLERCPHDLDAVADFLADCALHHAGRKCTALSGLLLHGGDPEPLLARLAARLDQVPEDNPLEPTARLAAFVDTASLLAHDQWLRTVAAEPGVRRWTRPAGWHVGAILRPALLQLPPESARFATELGGPVVTAVHLPAAADPLPYLQNSLAVTLVAAEEDLARRVLAAPGVHKCFRGLTPTYSTIPGSPHYGLLTEFLFTSKAVGEMEEACAWS